MMAGVTERPRTEADSEWTRGSFAVPPSAGTAPDGEWRTGYRYLAHLTRRDGVPVVDGVLITGPEINAAALRALKGLTSSVAILRDRPERAWRALRPIDDAYAALLAAWEDFNATAAASSDAENAPARTPLTRPDGTDPEGFSRRVAEAYLEAVARKDRAPAKTLAAEVGDVPVTTVHRWIRDARRSGFLGPAMRGRAAG